MKRKVVKSEDERVESKGERVTGKEPGARINGRTNGENKK